MPKKGFPLPRLLHTIGKSGHASFPISRGLGPSKKNLHRLHTGSTQPTDSLSAHLQNGGRVNLEPGFTYSVVRGLMEYEHNVRYEVGRYGGCQAIMRKNGEYFGASESRKDGEAVGY